MKRARVAETHPGGEERNRELGLIHVAKKKIGMADDAYRAVIRTISNQRTDSSGDLTGPERKALLKHLKTCGFKVEKKLAFPRTPLWMKAYAEWQKLADAGIVKNRTGDALAKFVMKNAGVENVAWVKEVQLMNAIEAIKDWGSRVAMARMGEGRK